MRDSATSLNPFVQAILLPATLLFVAMLNLTLVVAGLKELVVVELGGSFADAALFFTVEMAAYVLAAPLWGLASDRLGRRKPFIVAGFLASGLLYLALARQETIAALLALRFVQGAFAVAGWSTTMTLMLDAAADSRHGRIAGWMGGSLILGVALGAPLGGYVTRAAGPRAPLVAAGMLFLLLGLVALLLAEPRRHGARVRLAAIVDSLRAAPRLLLPWGFYALERLTVGLFIVVFPLYLASLGADDPVLRGRYLSVFLLPFAFLQVPAGRLVERFGALRMLLAGSIGYGALLATVGWSSLAGLWGVMLGLGILAAVMFPPTLALNAELAPAASRASAVAGLNIAGSLGFAIGPLFGTWAESAGGFPLAFALAGGLEILLAIIASALLLRRKRNEPGA